VRVASEVRAETEAAQDMAVSAVGETEGSAGGTGASGVSGAAEPGNPAGEAGSVPTAETQSRADADEAPDDAGAAVTDVTEAAEPGQAAASTEAPRGRRRIAVVLLFAALALILDTSSKALVVANLQNHAPIHVPGGFLNLVLIRNSGAAFSIGEGQTWVFTVIAAAVVFVILRVSRNLRSMPWAIALGLLLGGALGNLSDRLFRAPGVGRGDVVDFLQFPTFPVVHYDFPVFNLADTSIVVGGCLMVLLSFLGMQPDGTRHVSKDTAAPKDGDDA
jgi:signal peptidase II